MASDVGARMNDAASQSQERTPEPDQLITAPSGRYWTLTTPAP